MAEQTYSIEFDGYWGEKSISGIPEKSGIYCVYESTPPNSEKKITISKLIYIGESSNVNDRIKNHEKCDYWKKQLSSDKVLYFSFAPVDSYSRNRIEAALIFKHKPSVNTEYVECFPFDKTTIKLSGKTTKLNTEFTVPRKDF